MDGRRRRRRGSEEREVEVACGEGVVGEGVVGEGIVGERSRDGGGCIVEGVGRDPVGGRMDGQLAGLFDLIRVTGWGPVRGGRGVGGRR